jgi:hypothetical protein
MFPTHSLGMKAWTKEHEGTVGNWLETLDGLVFAPRIWWTNTSNESEDNTSPKCHSCNAELSTSSRSEVYHSTSCCFSSHLGNQEVEDSPLDFENPWWFQGGVWVSVYTGSLYELLRHIKPDILDIYRAWLNGEIAQDPLGLHKWITTHCGQWGRGSDLPPKAPLG